MGKRERQIARDRERQCKNVTAQIQEPSEQLLHLQRRHTQEHMQNMLLRYGRQALGEPDAASEAQTPAHIHPGYDREAATSRRCDRQQGRTAEPKAIRFIG